MANLDVYWGEAGAINPALLWPYPVPLRLQRNSNAKEVCLNIQEASHKG